MSDMGFYLAGLKQIEVFKKECPEGFQNLKALLDKRASEIKKAKGFSLMLETMMETHSFVETYKRMKDIGIACSENILISVLNVSTKILSDYNEHHPKAKKVIISKEHSKEITEVVNHILAEYGLTLSAKVQCHEFLVEKINGGRFDTDSTFVVK